MAALIETRPYFVLGDLVSNIAVGALVGVVMAAVLGPAWNMFLAMFVTMADPRQARSEGSGSTSS
jgi:hypothetical protein